MISFKEFIKDHELNEELLTENRIEFTKQRFTEKGINHSHDEYGEHKDTGAIVDHFAEHGDPTKKKLYTGWIADKYHAGDFRQEDHARIHDALSNFDKYKAKLHEKDIGKYPDLNSVEDAVQPHVGTAASKKEEIRQIKDDGSEVLHDDDDVSVRKIKTHEAAKFYGANTKWCTAGDSSALFDNYNKQGPLYVVNTKADNKKYQMHFESSQFMNDLDKPIDMNKFVGDHPAIKGIPEFQGKHFATTSPDQIDHMVNNAHQHDPDAAAHNKVLNQVAKESSNKDHLRKLADVKAPGDFSNGKSIMIYKHGLLQNKHSPIDVLHKITDEGHETDYSMYDHPNANKDLRAKLYARGKVADSIILNQKKTEPEIVKSVFDKTKSREMTNAAILHPNAPREIHDKLMEHPTWHAALAKSPSTPKEHLATLAKSKYDFVRANVAGNPNTPKEHVEALKDDIDPSVQEAAIKNKKAK
jgi:hypothetical protein